MPLRYVAARSLPEVASHAAETSANLDASESAPGLVGLGLVHVY